MRKKKKKERTRLYIALEQTLSRETFWPTSEEDQGMSGLKQEHVAVYLG